MEKRDRCRCGWYTRREKKYAMGNVPFETYSTKIYAQWQQARDEGRNVAGLEAACRAVQTMAENSPEDARRLQSTAFSLYDTMQAIPPSPKQAEEEPSDYSGILAQCTKNHFHGVPPEKSLVHERVLGGWAGRVAGCLLGKPLEFWALEPLRDMLREIENSPISRYIAAADFSRQMQEKYDIVVGSPLNKQPWIDEIGDNAPIDDDTNYTVLNLRLLETFGREFTPEDALFAWTNWLPGAVCCTAERIAYLNALQGKRPPETAVLHNPYREWVGAQIRAEIFGWVNPGNPQAAAEMAFRDACVSHVRNGIYGEMFIAAVVAAAMVSNDISRLISAGLSEIPEHSRLAKAIKDTINDYHAGMSYDEAVDKLHRRYHEDDMFDWCHTIPNAVIVVLSLLYSEGRFDKALDRCMRAGMDTDSNGAVVGAIMGTVLGFSGIPAYWTDCFHHKLASSVDGNHLLTLDELAQRTCALIQP